jgi:hypothetical protein
MSMLNLNLHGESEKLRDFFKKLLIEMGFFVIHQDDWGDGFRVIGTSAKRTSPLAATLMNLFIGYIHRKRIAVELTGTQKGEIVEASLRCSLYLDVFDMDAPLEKPEEKERCLRIATLFNEKITESFKQAT